MANNNRINFTKAAIDALPLPPSGQRVVYHDIKTNGLHIRVTSTGTKTFGMLRWISGENKPERITLGRFPDMTIDQARKYAMGVNAIIAEGKNPTEPARLARAEMTFGELFYIFMERWSKSRKRTWQDDENYFRIYLQELSGLQLSKISKQYLAMLHSQIGEKYPTMANRVLALVSSVFGRASEWGLWEGTNPALGIRRFPEKSRERFIQGDELPKFFASLAEEPNETIRDFFLLALLTGARRGNIQEMRWAEISFDRCEWRIPDTKNGTPQTVALAPMAMQLLKSRSEVVTGEWVFPGEGRTGHLVEPKSGWSRILRRAGLEDLRIHDLRRTLGSWQAATGSSLAIIGKSLNHKTVQATAIYARLNIDPVRQSVETAIDAMLNAARIAPKPTAGQ